MDDSFRNIEFELYGNLVQIKNILAYYDTQDKILTDISQTIGQIKSKTYNVAVMGEFRRGKSSLINALLGLDVLPSDVTPTTATINRITFGTEPKVVIYFKDGRKQDVNIAELQAYVTKITEENEKTALSIREAVIYYPTVICQNHVDIIDTPGLNDDEAMTRTTIDMLSNIDAVIVAVSALSPYSETEKNFVAQLIGTGGIRNIVFVVTFIDQIEEEELPKLLRGIRSRICTMTKEALEERFPNQPEILEKGAQLLSEDNMRLFAVSAKQALKSFASNDRRLLQKSRFTAFKEDLYKILTAQQSINIVEKTASLISLSALRFDHIYKDKFDAIIQRINHYKKGLLKTDDYFNSKNELLNRYQRESSARTDGLQEREPSLVGGIMNHFIGELTKVKTNSAPAIQAAIEAGRALSVKDMSLLAEKDLRELMDLFAALGRKMSRRRDELLLGYDEEAAAKKPEAFLKEYEEQLKAVPKPVFSFNDSVVPRCANLAHYNVITHIHKTVAASVQGYLTDIKRSMESCWAVCYAFLTYDDALRDGVQNRLRNELGRAETDMLVCRSNYQLHKITVENLQQDTDVLLSKFEHRGAN